MVIYIAPHGATLVIFEESDHEAVAEGANGLVSGRYTFT
jgi:hypothetical protein